MTIWNDGYVAYHAGKSSTDNPYDVGSPAYFEWLDGWISAAEGKTVLSE